MKMHEILTFRPRDTESL